MAADFYTQGFLAKLASYEKEAAYADTSSARKAVREKEDRLAGIKKPEPYVPPKNFKEELGRSVGRLGTNLKSLGIGLGTGAMNLGLRFGQGYLDATTWLPRLADQMVMGKLLGIDEGRGLFGRTYGEFERSIDKMVHAARKYSSDFDEKHGIKGGFNRFMNGIAPDVAGSFLGWGGYKKGLMNKIFSGWGAYGALSSDSQQGQLRKREAWIRSLHPLDRRRVDPTSTAYNQENAPTAAEYQRYHLPSYNLPTSATGKIVIPYSWRHMANDRPVNFREFGT